MAAQRSHSEYRPDIDGLRAVAVLAVVAFHAFPDWIQGGFIGVDVFFVISGYLISTIIFASLDEGTFSFSEFYSRRIQRIFPALILVLVACFAFGWFALLADERKELGKHIAAGAGFLSNLVYLNEAGYFSDAENTKPLLHLWSLGIEEQFYIFFPIFMWFSWKRKFNLLLVVFIVTSISFILNIYGLEDNDVAAFYSPQTRIWELLSGSLLVWAIRCKNIFYHDGNLRIYVKAVSNVMSFSGLFLLVYGFFGINKDLGFPGVWALVPVLGAVLIILAGTEAWVNRLILSNNIAVWFGLISFPLYLWHWPLLSFARIAEGDVPSGNIRITIVILSIFLAWLTYKLIETPMRISKPNSRKILRLIMAMTVIGLLGYSTYSVDSFSVKNKIKENNKLINELNRITGVYEYFNYKKIVRVDICHSVSLYNFNKNKCVDIRKYNIVIFGDSYAASLYPGLNYVRNKEFNDVGITQMTDGNGPPFFKNGKTDDGKTLFEANSNRIKIVSEIKPQIVLINWMVGGANDVTTKEESLLEINKTIDKIISISPTSKVIIVGSFPKWKATLRRQMINYFNKTQLDPPFYMSYGLDYADKEFDLFLSKNIKIENVKYISPYDYMCTVEGCLTRVTDNASDLTAVDWGHLTNAGSIFLAEKIKSLIFQF